MKYNKACNLKNRETLLRAPLMKKDTVTSEYPSLNDFHVFGSCFINFEKKKKIVMFIVINRIWNTATENEI